MSLQKNQALHPSTSESIDPSQPAMDALDGDEVQCRIRSEDSVLGEYSEWVDVYPDPNVYDDDATTD